ncbi:MAG TPA: hypothetical protein VFB54_03405 [Burkholderiales bacterium]|nr:hypothetical protein [Burkholderiales bacterium]
MARLLSHALLLLSLHLALPAFAQERIVPIEDEPKHVLKFQNAHVRFFDVQLPPGYEGLWHTHLHDGVFVNIAAGPTRAQDLGGAAQTRPPRDAGETYFINYTKKPKAHRVSNIGDTAYRVTDTEVHQACSTPWSVPSNGQDGKSHSLILENERVQVIRILLSPGERVALRPGCAMLVAVTPGKVTFESQGPTKHVEMYAAAFKWRESMLPLTLLNQGSETFHAVDIVIK